jgi:DNA-binding NtrC family response regulator
LRVLQEGTFERLGGDATLKCDVRLISATNQNLENAIAEKRFREDLYYRLKGVAITLPALRQRKEDLPDLVRYFMAKHGAQLKKESVSLAPEAMQILRNYDWPGNVRELEHLLKRAILLAKHNVITPEVITGDLHPGEKSAAMPPSGDRLALFVCGDLERYYGKLYETVIAEVEKDLIVSALRRVGGNQVKAAQLLGISRVMLHDRIEKYGIKTEMIVQPAESAA